MKESSKSAYERLLAIQQNEDGNTALAVLDQAVVLFNECAGEIKALQGVQQCLRTIAQEILDELGSASEKTPHGKVTMVKDGTSRSVDYDALNELCKNDPDFAAKYLPHFSEKPRKGGIRIS